MHVTKSYPLLWLHELKQSQASASSLSHSIAPCRLFSDCRVFSPLFSTKILIWILYGGVEDSQSASTHPQITLKKLLKIKKPQADELAAAGLQFAVMLTFESQQLSPTAAATA